MAITEGWGDDSATTIPADQAPKGIVEGWGDGKPASVAAPDNPQKQPGETGFFGRLRFVNRKLGEWVDPVTNQIGQAARDELAMFQKGATLGFAPAMGAAYDAVTSGKTFAQARAERAAEQGGAEERSGIPGKVAEFAGGAAAGGALPVGAALEAASPVVRGAVVGGGLGAVQGAGETVSAGGTPGEVLANASAGAMGGAITGGALEGLAGKLVKGAPESADSWIVKDIAGQGDTAAGDKATDKLRMDADDVRRVIKSDPELAAAAEKASGHDLPALKTFQGALDERLANEAPSKAAEYVKVAEAKPIRFGDLDAQLETAQKALPVSQRGIAKEIAGERAALREGWASKDAVEIPEAALDKELAPGFSVRQALSNYTAAAAKGSDQAKQAITEIESQFGKSVRKYDPDTIVDPMKLRQHVTALQDTAGRSQDVGAATPSERNIAANKVKRPFEQFFYKHLDDAAETSPEAQRAVNAIRDSDAKVSALINMKQAVNQRVVMAERNATEGMQPAFGFRGAIHRAGQKLGLGPFALPALALGMGHAPVAAGLAMTMAAPAAKRAADKALARLIQQAASGSVGHKLILHAIEQGVPRAVALRVASSAAGGLINDVVGGEPLVQPQQVSP